MINTNPGPYEAAVLADSIAGDDVRLTTMVCTFPRFILAEYNTHRVFSRNSASSRAIPVKKRIKMIEEDPFIPLAFGKNKRGMSSTEDLQGEDAKEAERVWREACRDAVEHAQKLADLGVHKQFANRILEPFAWHTVITTSTEWDNYWSLRISEFAQPEICKVSEAMKAAYDASTPKRLRLNEWHLPLIFEQDIKEYTTKDEFGDDVVNYEELAKISCARCARVSYLTHDGVRSLAKDFELFDRLASAGHMSPFEHAAVAGEIKEYWDNGSVDYEVQYKEDWFDLVDQRDFIGNFRAPWIQYRKMIPGEEVYVHS